MKKKTILPMPPTDQLPYENIKEEWSSLTFDRYVVRMAQLYWASWPLTEKIWPNFTYNNEAWGIMGDHYSWFLLPDQTIEKRLSNELSDEIKDLDQEVDYNSYPLYRLPISEEETDEKFKKPFDKGEIEIFPTSNLLFTIYSHELFHGHQREWVYPDPPMDINTPDIIDILAKNPEARKLRLALFENIRNALLFPLEQERYLNIAKYWANHYYEKYAQEAELIQNIDFTEGSARYFEIAITCRALFGFDCTKEEMRAHYTKLVMSHFTPKRIEENIALEPYNIGGIAGLLLELNNISDWQNRVASGQRLEDVLLENYIPCAP